ncbi:unnamed protein product [Lactuca virosa]|uniref:Uncharacterized protein n=1 Tax=Lactuca virosa TaxID=75947 RepID=A0AAU9PQ44_9ASTR|nr:unnamed protein product [Lactuca virosa]
MLKKVNPTHKILVKYLKNVNPNVQTGVLLEVEAGSSKPSKKTKSDGDELKVTKNKSSPKQVKGDDSKKPEEKEARPSKEVVPTKSGVLKRLRNISSKRTSSEDSQTVRKTQVSSKGVVIREIPAPASPSSKKRRAHDVAKHITEKRYKRRLVVRDDSSDNEAVPETPLLSIAPMPLHADFRCVLQFHKPSSWKPPQTWKIHLLHMNEAAKREQNVLCRSGGIVMERIVMERFEKLEADWRTIAVVAVEYDREFVT